MMSCRLRHRLKDIGRLLPKVMLIRTRWGTEEGLLCRVPERALARPDVDERGIERSIGDEVCRRNGVVWFGRLHDLDKVLRNVRDSCGAGASRGDRNCFDRE